MRSIRKRAGAAAAALAAALLATAAPAQDAGEADLRALQERQFEQMFAEPDNLDLMFQYAQTSIRLKDYEAAITTLDRMLIFNPNLPRVRLELAAAFFRIGSYPIARYNFEQVTDDPEADEELKARAAEFIAEIDDRTRQSYVTGVVGLSGLFSTNANNGPDSREILFLGVTAQLTGDEVTSQTDAGVAFSAQATHVYDLGGANGDTWRSDVALYSQRFASTPSGAADILVLRSGPRLSLDETRYGPKLRPYVELDHVRSENDALYATAGLGAELTANLDTDILGEAEARVGWRDYMNSGSTDKDGPNIRARAGVTWFMDDATSLRLRALSEFDGADDPSERSIEFGAEAGLRRSYDSGMSFAARQWRADATARATARFFDEPGIADTTRKRKDFDLRLSFGNTAYLESNLALTLRAEYFLRDSNIRNFDLDSVTVSAGVQYAF